MCAHYGWSWQYLHWGVRWAIVQRMALDAPGYLPKDTAEPDHEVTPVDDSGLKAQMESLFGDHL